MRLHPSFLARPIAHRGYHDRRAGRIENSPAAFDAAMRAGYGIELDLQLSRDGQAMVFHDDHLGRLTEAEGAVAERDASDLSALRLRGSGDTVPSLATVLAQVAGRVPLLVELKDQDGQMGETDGRLEAAVAADLAGYAGTVALMSFNPHSVARMAALCPGIARGLTTCAMTAEDEPGLSAERRAELRAIPDYDRTGACFVSHDIDDLPSARVAELQARGAQVLCWTVRSPDAEARARQFADNITFESYAA